MNIQINAAELATVMAGILVVGSILKNAFPAFPNRFIPLATWLMGVIGYQTMVSGWNDPKQWLAAIVAVAAATGTHSATKNTIQPTNDGDGGKLSAPTVTVLWMVAMLSLCGCSTFTTEQSDVSGVDSGGQPTRTITTRAKARTFFDSSSALANFRATQTDKTQGASVGSLNQQSSGSNAVQTLKIVVEAAPAIAAAAGS